MAQPQGHPRHRGRYRRDHRPRKLTLRRTLALAAAWTLLAFTRLLVLLAPFGLVRRLLGSTSAPAGLPAAAPDRRALARAAAVGRTLTTASAHTPWRSDCYPQALAARILLRALRVPHTVMFGVRRDDSGDLRAHAWVTAGDVTVTGGSAERWTDVASFAWNP